MSTRDAIIEQIENYGAASVNEGASLRRRDSARLQSAYTSTALDERDRLVALIDAALCPPAPGEVRIDDAMVEAGAMVIPGKWEAALELSRLVLTAALAAAAAPGER